MAWNEARIAASTVMQGACAWAGQWWRRGEHERPLHGKLGVVIASDPALAAKERGACRWSLCYCAPSADYIYLALVLC